MGLFKSDLYRSLALGFIAGALGLAVVMGTGNASLSENVLPPAQAAAPQK